jgi:hypothetical protein
MYRALNAGVRALNFDSDDDNTHEHSPSHRARPSIPVRGLFSDDEDEGHGASSSGTSSGTSARSSVYRRPRPYVLSDVESDDESSLDREQLSATSGVRHGRNVSCIIFVYVYELMFCVAWLRFNVYGSIRS